MRDQTARGRGDATGREAFRLDEMVYGVHGVMRGGEQRRSRAKERKIDGEIGNSEVGVTAYKGEAKSTATSTATFFRTSTRRRARRRRRRAEYQSTELHAARARVVAVVTIVIRRRARPALYTRPL